MRIPFFLPRIPRGKRRLKRRFADFCSQLIDPFLGPIAFS
jgi:hypothetical protein